MESTKIQLPRENSTTAECRDFRPCYTSAPDGVEWMTAFTRIRRYSRGRAMTEKGHGPAFCEQKGTTAEGSRAADSCAKILIFATHRSSGKLSG
jgi:hypothetical protein